MEKRNTEWTYGEHTRIEVRPYLFDKLEFVFCMSAGNDEGLRLQPKAPSDEGA